MPMGGPEGLASSEALGKEPLRVEMLREKWPFKRPFSVTFA